MFCRAACNVAKIDGFPNHARQTFPPINSSHLLARRFAVDWAQAILNEMPEKLCENFLSSIVQWDCHPHPTTGVLTIDATLSS